MIILLKNMQSQSKDLSYIRNFSYTIFTCHILTNFYLFPYFQWFCWVPVGGHTAHATNPKNSSQNCQCNRCLRNVNRILEDLVHSFWIVLLLWSRDFARSKKKIRQQKFCQDHAIYFCFSFPWSTKMSEILNENCHSSVSELVLKWRNFSSAVYSFRLTNTSKMVSLEILTWSFP